jgi:hypothetical protein
MGSFDSFTIAVLASAVVVVVVFGLMIILDKGRAATPSASAPAKVAGKR